MQLVNARDIGDRAVAWNDHARLQLLYLSQRFYPLPQIAGIGRGRVSANRVPAKHWRYEACVTLDALWMLLALLSAPLKRVMILPTRQVFR